MRDRSLKWCHLLAADAEASALALEEWIKSRRRSSSKMVLGSYFSFLFEYYLRFGLRVEELHASTRVIEGKTTLGSLKYVWKDAAQQKIVHMEISVKFFCWYQDSEVDLVGPHLTETLGMRRRYAARKIRVAQLARPRICDFLGSPSQICSIAAMKGFIFYPLANISLPKPRPRHLQTDSNHHRFDGEKSCTLPRGGDLLDEHEARWYCRERELALLRKKSRFSPDEGYKEAWVVLPKLYWMAPVVIKERGGSDAANLDHEPSIPLLTFDEVCSFAQKHFQRHRPSAEEEEAADPSTLSRKEKRARRLHAVAPLLIAQMKMFMKEKDLDSDLTSHQDRNLHGSREWVEVTRGFVVPDYWNPASILQQAGEQPVAPVTVRNAEDLQCLFPGISSPQLSSRTVPAKPMHTSSCRHCRSGFVKNLSACADNSSRLDLIYLNIYNPSGTIISRKHINHVVKAVANWLSLTYSLSEIRSFLFESLSGVIRLEADEAFGMIIIRICDSALKRREAAEEDESQWESGALMTLLQRVTHCAMSQRLLGAAFENVDELAVEKCESSPSVTQQLRVYIEEDLLKSGRFCAGKIHASLFVGLVKVVRFDISIEVAHHLLRKLVDARLFKQGKQLCEACSEQVVLRPSFIRLLLSRARNFKMALEMEECLNVDIRRISAPHRPDRCVPRLFTLWNSFENSSILFVDTLDKLEQAEDLVSLHPGQSAGRGIIGLDCEWGDDDADEDHRGLSLIQLCIDEERVVVVDLMALSGHVGRTMAFLEQIMNNQRNVLIGFSVGEDITRFRHTFGPMLSKTLAVDVVDCQCMLAGVVEHDTGLQDPFQKGLDYWTRRVLKHSLDKQYQCSAWHVRPLSVEQLRYAAMDAVAPRKISLALTTSLGRPPHKVFSEWHTTYILHPGNRHAP